MINRRGVVASLGLLLCSGYGLAQQPNQPIKLPTAAPGMPGQVVGSSYNLGNVKPVGTRFPGAVPLAGQPVGTRPGAPASQQGAMGLIQQPPGTPINMQNVVAPYPNMPGPELGFWDRIYQSWASLFVSDAPSYDPPRWTPGLGRRNRDRNNFWRRD